MRRILSLAAALAVAGCADQAPAPVNVAAAAPAAAAPASGTQVCRKERVTGANLMQTKCHIVGGDPQEDASNENTLRDMQRQGTQQVQRSLNSSH